MNTDGPRRRFRGSRLLDIAIVVCTIALGVTAATRQGATLGPVGALVADAFQRAAPRPYDPAAPVRIVEIDAESLRRFGQWPWPRPYLAELIRRLQALGAAAIAFDILFAEPDRTSPELLIDTANRFATGAAPALRPTLDTLHDTAFAEAIGQAPVVLAALPGMAHEDEPPLDRLFGMVVAGGDPRPRMVSLGGLDRPLPLLVAAASGYGVGGIPVGESAIVRRLPLFSIVGGDIAPAISMEALRVAQQASNYVIRTSTSSVEAGGGVEPEIVDARNGGIVMPLSGDGTIWVRHAGPQRARFIPAWQLLDGQEPDPRLEDRILGHIVFVAATAPGLAQRVETPLGAGIHPAEVHAEVVEQVLAGIALQRPDWAPGAEALTVIAVGLVTAAVTLGSSALTGFVLGGVLPLTVMAGSWLAFTRLGLLLSPVTPVLTGAALYTLLTAVNYFRYRRDSGAVRAQFERFVAPAVIRQLVADPDSRDAMRGSSRDLTVMFADARGFTRMSETMPPDALIAYLNECFGEMTEAVLAGSGTIDKYMGDCIMAFWNAPLDVPNHAEQALRTCFAIRAAQLRLNPRFAAEGKPQVEFGVGLNTGPCSVGLMGSSRRLEYSCVGDTVNVASRLQDLTKQYGVWNIAAAAVVEAAPGWTVLPLGRASLRNRSVPVPIVSVLGPPGEPLAPAEAAFLEAALAARSAGAATPAGRAALDALRGMVLPGLNGAQLARAIETTAREAA